MSDSNNDNSSMEGFWDGLGFAMVILAFCLGVGGCEYLIGKGIGAAEAAKHGTVAPTP